MKTEIDTTGLDARRAAAKRTAMIVGAIAIALFVFSILEVALSK